MIEKVLVISLSAMFLAIPYLVVHASKKSVWKTLVYGTLIWIGIAIAVPVIFFGLLYGLRCEDWLLNGTANWYQSIVGGIFLLIQVVLGLVVVLSATGLGGFISFTGPRGGEYRMSETGKSKVYITKK